MKLTWRLTLFIIFCQRKVERAFWLGSLRRLVLYSRFHCRSRGIRSGRVCFLSRPGTIPGEILGAGDNTYMLLYTHYMQFFTWNQNAWQNVKARKSNK
jgi:hypothetical protein